MTITFKQVQQSGLTTGTSQTVTITPSVAGDIMILSIGVFQNGAAGTLSSVVDNNGNTWHPAIAYTIRPTVVNAVANAVYYANGVNSGSTTITANFSGSVQDIGLIVIEYSGCASSNPIDVTGTGNGSTASVSAPTISVSAGEMVCSFIYSDNTVSAIGGSYNQRGSLSLNGAGDELAASTGNFTGTWTTSSGQWITQMVALSSTPINPPPTPTITIPQFAQKETNGVNPITTSFSSNDTAGNAIVVIAANDDTTPLTWTSVTDSESNTYVACVGASVNDTSSHPYQMAMFVAFSIKGGTTNTISAHFTGTSSNLGLYAFEVQGISAYDDGSGNSTLGVASGTASSGQFLLHYPYEIIIAATMTIGAALSPGIGYTQLAITATYSNMLEYAVPMNGSNNATVTMTGSTTWAMVAGAFYLAKNIVLPTDTVFYGIT